MGRVMVAIGYTMMGEQAGRSSWCATPSRAEEAGFDFLAASDHYFPWLEEQGTRRTHGRCSARSPTRPNASS